MRDEDTLFLLRKITYTDEFYKDSDSWSDEIARLTWEIKEIKKTVYASLLPIEVSEYIDGYPNVQIKDAPALSPRRILNAIRFWLWLVAVEDFQISLWGLIKYYRRPEAANRNGVY